MLFNTKRSIKSTFYPLAILFSKVVNFGIVMFLCRNKRRLLLILQEPTFYRGHPQIITKNNIKKWVYLKTRRRFGPDK